jgi:hypothetical protein
MEDNLEPSLQVQHQLIQGALHDLVFLCCMREWKLDLSEQSAPFGSDIPMPGKKKFHLKFSITKFLNPPSVTIYDVQEDEAVQLCIQIRLLIHQLI